MESARLNHLEELKGSDFKIAEGRPNIQDWDIVDYKGDKLGRVQDMLFDKEAQKVRYIITNVDGDRDVLIPIGKANLDIPNERVVIPNLTVVQLTGLPSYNTKDITSEQEFAIRSLFVGTSAGGIIPGTTNSPYDHQTFYDHDDFDEDRFYNRGDYNDPIDDTSRVDDMGRSDLSDSENLGNSGTLRDVDDVRDTDDLGNIRDRNRKNDDPFSDDVNDPYKL